MTCIATPQGLQRIAPSLSAEMAERRMRELDHVTGQAQLQAACGAQPAAARKRDDAATGKQGNGRSLRSRSRKAPVAIINGLRPEGPTLFWGKSPLFQRPRKNGHAHRRRITAKIRGTPYNPDMSKAPPPGMPPRLPFDPMNTAAMRAAGEGKSPSARVRRAAGAGHRQADRDRRNLHSAGTAAW